MAGIQGDANLLPAAKALSDEGAGGVARFARSGAFLCRYRSRQQIMIPVLPLPACMHAAHKQHLDHPTGCGTLCMHQCRDERKHCLCRSSAEHGPGYFMDQCRKRRKHYLCGPCVVYTTVTGLAFDTTHKDS